MTVDQRVHQYLSAHEGSWVCGLTLARPTIGGLRAAARVHSLRSQGVLIESKSCDCYGCKQRRNLALIDGRRFSPVACYRLTSGTVAA